MKLMDVDWNTISFVLSSKIRLNILILLRQRPMTPTEISKELKISLSHASKYLKELKEKNLVLCLTERRKNRYYTITNYGEKILKEIKSLF